MFSVTMNKGICEAGFYVDNIKFYKGQAESVDKDCFYSENDIISSFNQDFEGDSPQMPTIVSKKSYTKAEVVGNEDIRELFVYSNRTSIPSADSAVNLFNDSTLNAKETFTVEYDM